VDGIVENALEGTISNKEAARSIANALNFPDDTFISHLKNDYCETYIFSRANPELLQIEAQQLQDKLDRIDADLNFWNFGGYETLMQVASHLRNIIDFHNRPRETAYQRKLRLFGEGRSFSVGFQMKEASAQQLSQATHEAMEFLAKFDPSEQISHDLSPIHIYFYRLSERFSNSDIAKIAQSCLSITNDTLASFMPPRALQNCILLKQERYMLSRQQATILYEYEVLLGHPEEA